VTITGSPVVAEPVVGSTVEPVVPGSVVVLGPTVVPPELEVPVVASEVEPLVPGPSEVALSVSVPVWVAVLPLSPQAASETTSAAAGRVRRGRKEEAVNIHHV
jgi:hypothetical protein